MHRQLSPLEPISWQIGHQSVDAIDVNMLLRDYPEKLDLGVFGLGHRSEDDEIPGGVAIPAAWGQRRWTYRAFVEHLRQSYADTLSVEHQHIDSDTERKWLEERLEGRHSGGAAACPSLAQRCDALWRLVRADQLERLLDTKYHSAKRFGIQGCEVLLPCLWMILEQASKRGVEDLRLGMAHRGRLNVLVNLLGKAVSNVCSEFGEQVDFLGDVRYHLGTRCEVEVGGRTVQMTLSPNPSHLEQVDPVVLGMTRAKQDYTGDASKSRIMAALIHGDAAFSGQGVVAECMQLAALPAYTTGGTIHIVINNMVGFTTDPRIARSSYHCTNIAKVTNAPVIHVNADDVDAVLFASVLAADYRHTFGQDIVIDLHCYRRLGHSEVDDASPTQPLTMRTIQGHPPVFRLYTQKLVDAGIVSEEDVAAKTDDVFAEFEAEYEYSKTHVSSSSDWRVKDWKRRPVNVTGLPRERLEKIGRACCRIPEGFSAHETVKNIFRARLRRLERGVVDWAFAETLAMGSLLLNFDPDKSPLTTGLMDGSDPTNADGHVDKYVAHPPCPVRLSGQDVERGTFNQRHHVIYDQETARPYKVLSDLGMGPQSEAVICNSSLSELAVLGFEYGYSLEEHMALTIWEAQFGDFANCAQTIIDTFVASGESKWGSKSCLVLLLPHGYEGQGPDHSSARPERFLQLLDDDPDDLWPRRDHTSMDLPPCLERHEALDAVVEALDAARAGCATGLARARRKMALLQETVDYSHNLSVVNITTPANIFHVLRRQVHREFSKPLVVLSAKYLLHHKPCMSPFAHMAEGTRFQRLIVEGWPGDNMPHSPLAQEAPPLRRWIFCSGKVFYELYHARKARKLQGAIGLARLEQIAPFPSLEVAVAANLHPDAELLWVQEEPKNMGAWTYVAPRIATALRQLSPTCVEPRRVRYVGRPPAANPATPLFKQHKLEVRAILDEALSLA